jgi:hypothetical protein
MLKKPSALRSGISNSWGISTSLRQNAMIGAVVRWPPKMR